MTTTALLCFLVAVCTGVFGLHNRGLYGELQR